MLSEIGQTCSGQQVDKVGKFEDLRPFMGNTFSAVWESYLMNMILEQRKNDDIRKTNN